MTLTPTKLHFDLASVVYAVQAARVNLFPATAFGTVRTLLPEGDVNFSLELAVEKLSCGLASFRSGDYILPVGDPTAIGIACAIASHRTGGRFNVLKWDRQERRYLPLSVDLTAALYS